MGIKYKDYKAKYTIKMCTPDQLHDYQFKTTEEILALLFTEPPRQVFECLCALTTRDLNDTAFDAIKEVNDNGETFKNRRLANNILCQLFPEHSKDLLPGESKQIGYVYFIKNKTSGLIKIGRTRDIERRVTIFTRLFSFPIELIQHFKTLNYEKIEKSFHTFYKSKRKYGEWFKLDEQDLKQILEKAFPDHIQALIVS
jgi:hypothetical protein